MFYTVGGHCRRRMSREGDAAALQPMSRGLLLSGKQLKTKDIVMKRMLMVIVLIGVFGVTLADSSATEMKPATSFGYLDVDKDQRVSPVEAKADWAVAQRFEQADLDHNGYLDKEEFQALIH
jgi:EF hand domain-containing protein